MKTLTMRGSESGGETLRVERDIRITGIQVSGYWQSNDVDARGQWVLRRRASSLLTGDPTDLIAMVSMAHTVGAVGTEPAVMNENFWLGPMDVKAMQGEFLILNTTLLAGSFLDAEVLFILHYEDVPGVAL